VLALAFVTTRLQRLAGLFGGVALCCASCDRSGTSVDFRHNRNGKGTPVASLGGDSITTEELQKRFQEMSPYARARYQTVDQRKEYLDGLARFEVLAQEALRRGLQNEPEVVEMAKKVMVQKLIQQELDGKNAAVPENELAAYYDKHKSDYVKPEMVRATALFLMAARADADAVKAKRAQMDALLEKAKALSPNDYAGFGKLAREHSEDAKSKALDGDLRYLSAQEMSAQLGPAVSDAAFALKANGELSNIVQTESGFYLLKLQGRQAPLNLTLDQVRPQLQGRIANEHRQQNFDKLVESLKRKSNYTLDDAALAKVEVDIKAPTREAKGPPPGFLPAGPGAPPQ
jgi:peptidyl-prolyl cis-trans isomerase C